MPNKASQQRPLRGLDLRSGASRLHYGRCRRRYILENFGDFMKIGLFLSGMFLLVNSALAAPPWYTSKVVEVTTQANGILFIRTASNPNPKNCASTWAGAVFEATTPEAKQLAASIALTAKASGATLRFQIDDQSCALNNGWPKMLWIQVQ